jgi:hypothetical protein
VAGFVDHHATNATRIEKFVHLCIMGQNQALPPKPAVISNRDEETKLGVYPR